MGIAYPANVVAVLSDPVVKIVKRVELLREYWNADLRLTVDVSEDAVKFSELKNESTLKLVNWTVANLTVSLNNALSRYSTDHALSIWQATFARKPRECAVIFRLMLPMPDGTLYELQKYMGSVEDCVPRDEGEIAVVDIVTKHMSHRPLSVKLTKSSGDETVLTGTTW
jgi:hypothetical protein